VWIYAQTTPQRNIRQRHLSLRLVRHAYARHHSKNRQADTCYLAVDAWRRHVSPDEGIGKSPVISRLLTAVFVPWRWLIAADICLHRHIEPLHALTTPHSMAHPTVREAGRKANSSLEHHRMKGNYCKARQFHGGVHRLGTLLNHSIALCKYEVLHFCPTTSHACGSFNLGLDSRSRLATF
jgi:hypothetical protein